MTDRETDSAEGYLPLFPILLEPAPGEPLVPDDRPAPEQKAVSALLNFNRRLQKHPPLQRGIIWSEILGPPVSLRD